MKNRRWKILFPIIALAVCAVVVLMERNGVVYEEEEKAECDFEKSYTAAVDQKAECLMLIDADSQEDAYADIMGTVLDGMRVGYDTCTAQSDELLELLPQYRTVVVAFEDWGSFGDNLQGLVTWVKNGGSLMNTATPQPNSSFGSIYSRVGIDVYSGEYTGINGLRFDKEFMLGAKTGDIFYFEEEDSEKIDISLGVGLSTKCTTYISSADGIVPILWKAPYGEGKFVIINESITDRYQRGFYAAAYSLLDDAVFYPVINGSAYYLDDFPSPVPGGNGEYIEWEYGVDIATFYSTIWWPDVLGWEERYGIKHTGMIIELYSDDVEAPFVRNLETRQFVTYGNMLLNNGGELGLHGYNHMPLCLEGVDENMQYGTYNLWTSPEAIGAAVNELLTFSSRLFPQEKFQVYVPPSNILSEAGKEALLAAAPDIRVLASTYLPDADAPAYIQEFEVEESGVIDTPRITSGCDVDNYQKISEMAELNFHYVQSHFLHPDDVLDEDRGASLGWKELRTRFEKYLDWIYESVPDIRNVTGSEMGVAVQQYDTLSVERIYEENALAVKLGGFSDEAYFMLRVNEGEIADTAGCTYEEIGESLYLIHATTDELRIEWK